MIEWRYFDGSLGEVLGVFVDRMEAEENEIGKIK